VSKDLTPRIHLIKESDDEIIDPFAYNWPLVDAAVGAKMVAAGVTPPNSELFDGCIVSEATTGKSWIARADGAGGYTKKWLTYPWQLYGIATAVPIANSFSPSLYASLVYSAGQSINASAADVVSGQLVLPVDGIYELDLSVRWAAASSTGSDRSAAISINSDISAAERSKSESMIPNSATNVSTITTCSTFRPLAAGTTVATSQWQSIGVTLNADYSLRAALVIPL
jgi:hypothetical protein